MRMFLMLIAVTLIPSAVLAETRITDQGNRLLIEITGEPERSVNPQPAETPPPLNQLRSAVTKREAFVDPGSADYLRGRIEELRRELAELQEFPPSETPSARRERYQRINEKQRLVQQHSADLNVIRRQATAQ